MKGTLTCLEKDKDRFFEATDIALIPPRLMPIWLYLPSYALYAFLIFFKQIKFLILIIFEILMNKSNNQRTSENRFDEFEEKFQLCKAFLLPFNILDEQQDSLNCELPVTGEFHLVFDDNRFQHEAHWRTTPSSQTWRGAATCTSMTFRLQCIQQASCRTTDAAGITYWTCWGASTDSRSLSSSSPSRCETTPLSTSCMHWNSSCGEMRKIW